MVAVAVVVYFLAAEWSPCHRGRQALIVCVLFNLWTILPLATSIETKQRSNTLTTNISIPFWTPPPHLYHASTAARGLMYASCMTFPSLVMRAKIIPEGVNTTLLSCVIYLTPVCIGMREFVPLPIRLFLSLLMLLLKLVVVLFLLLPFNLLMVMMCTSGICVAFSALWVVRSLAWVSACIVLMCMHICCTCLSSARGVVDYCHHLTIQGKDKLTAKPPSAQLPSPSFHDIRALHAHATSQSDSFQKGPTVPFLLLSFHLTTLLYVFR